MQKSVSSYRKTFKVTSGCLTDEGDFIKVDDTWLKVSKILIDTLRYQFQNARLKPYKEKNVEAYLKVTNEQMA